MYKWITKIAKFHGVSRKTADFVESCPYAVKSRNALRIYCMSKSFVVAAILSSFYAACRVRKVIFTLHSTVASLPSFELIDVARWLAITASVRKCQIYCEHTRTPRRLDHTA